MKMTEWQKKRTFGPVVEHMKDDGSWRAYCTWSRSASAALARTSSHRGKFPTPRTLRSGVRCEKECCTMLKRWRKVGDTTSSACVSQPDKHGMMHPTHKARVSDSSLYDEVCVHCNLTDMSPGWSRPCKRAAATEPAARLSLDLSKPPFMTRDGTPMHFVGYGMGGETIWQYPDGEVVRRSANGGVDMCEVYKSLGDIINAQPRIVPIELPPEKDNATQTPAA